MAFVNNSFSYLNIGQARINNNGTVGQTEIDEVSYDPATMTYRTRSQQVEINRLRDELVKKSEKRKQDIKSIIGYYYKRN